MLNMCVYVCYSLFIYENMTTHTYKMTFADVLVNGFTNFKAVQYSLVKLAKYAKTFHKHPRISTNTHTNTHMHPCMQAQAKQVKLHVRVSV